MKIIMTALLVLFVSGCAHYLYQGDFKAKNNLDEVSNFRLYWTRTDPFIGDDKAGPMVLNVECGTAIELTESETGIEFVEASDKYESINGETGNKIVCARVTNLNRFLDYSEGDILISSLCKPIVDDEGFSAIVPLFLATEPDLHRISINVKKKRSLISSAMKAPVLICP